MSVSENITCTSAHNSLGCSFPLLGTYTGNEREVTPLSTKKIPKSSQGQYQALWIYVLPISGLSNQEIQKFPWYL